MNVSLSGSELLAFINDFSKEYCEICILVEDFTAIDYPGYYNTFWECFDEYMQKRKSFNAADKLGSAYADAHKEIMSRVDKLECPDIKASFSQKPTTPKELYEKMKELFDAEGRVEHDKSNTG